MWSRPLGANIQDNPLVESPYCQQEDIGIAYKPPVPRYLLLTDGTDFLLTDGTQMDLAYIA